MGQADDSSETYLLSCLEKHFSWDVGHFCATWYKTQLTIYYLVRNIFENKATGLTVLKFSSHGHLSVAYQWCWNKIAAVSQPEPTLLLVLEQRKKQQSDFSGWEVCLWRGLDTVLPHNLCSLLVAPTCAHMCFIFHFPQGANTGILSSHLEHSVIF